MATERCNTPGDLVVDGRAVATIRCELWAEHAGPHGVTLIWESEAPSANVDDWPERDDPAEPFDVEVDLEVQTRLAQEAYIDAEVDARRDERAFDD